MNGKKAFYDHIAQTSDTPAGLEIERAEGCLIYTTDGKSYVDLISGISVSSLGHRHPAVLKAVRDQLDHHMHVMVYGEFIQKTQSGLAQLLCDQLPASLSRVYFVNSGTEAVEGALKLAKKFTGRQEIVSFENSYHGDTHGSLSVTGRSVYRDPFMPLLPGVTFAGFNSMEALEVISDSTAAVILEPIQGEGGIIPADREWLKAVGDRCNETGTLLIFDEIQTGFYRTGDLFAFEFYDVVPDILCLAKAMGGGMPLGAFVSSDEIFRVFREDPPLNHVTTFGGHPVSCAAALANLEVLLADDFGQKARRIEEISRGRLKGKGITELRGRGAMLGLQLESRELASHVVTDCMQKGIILGWTLHSDTLIRIAPPLVITEDLLNHCFDTILESISE